MIKFFSKIRQKLVSEGNTRKYLKYAIGEIVLVVIGILIALQINNWNESIKQSISEEEFIERVKNDIQQDKVYIQQILEINKPKIRAFKALNNNVIHLFNNDRKSLDSIFQIYFKSQRTFYPLSGSFESAVSGNQIILFRNKDLIQKLIKLYHSTYDRLVDNGQILDERWDYLSKKYSYERRTGHFREMNPEQLSAFLDDLYHHYAQLEWYLKQLKSTIAEIDEISLSE